MDWITIITVIENVIFASVICGGFIYVCRMLKESRLEQKIYEASTAGDYPTARLLAGMTNSKNKEEEEFEPDEPPVQTTEDQNFIYTQGS